ncbi:pathogenicity island protein, partial [Staphylococcus haemolyticus]|nr:pathogenicity island protein [Staphylococcus haemolyticus]
MTIITENKLTNDHIKVLNVLRNTKHEIITKQNIFNQLKIW